MSSVKTMSVNISEILVGMVGILSDSSKVKVDLKKVFSSSRYLVLLQIQSPKTSLSH